MSNKKKRVGPVDIVLLVLTILSVAGLLTVFKGCGPKEDGSWMVCHWAEQAETGLSIVLAVCAVFHILAPDPGVKRGLDLALIPTALFAVILPGNVISLCMMDTMRCHVFTRPFVLVVNILVMAAAVIDLLIHRKK